MLILVIIWSFITIPLLLFCLFGVEYYLRLKSPNDTAKYIQNPRHILTYLNNRSGIRHIAGPFQYKAKMTEIEKKKYDQGFNISVNKFGFFTDVPIDEYKIKDKNEFVILLVGGSGAQGWGASTNEKMFYKLLEDTLNEKNIIKSDYKKIKVINLAMAGGHLISNYQILHAYGKHLQADMIMAYVGVNDTLAIMEHGAFLPRQDVGYIVDRSKTKLSNFYDKFPLIMHKHGVSEKINKILGITFNKVSMGQYNQQELSSHKIFNKDPTDFFEKIVIPKTINSLKKIKQEFCGIPIILIRQIFAHPELTQYWLRNKRNILLKSDKGNNVYDYWWNKIIRGTMYYENKNWFYIDPQAFIWEYLNKNSSIPINKDTFGLSQNNNVTYNFNWIDGKQYKADAQTFYVHLDNVGQKILTDIVSPHIIDIINQNSTRKHNNKCKEAYM